MQWEARRIKKSDNHSKRETGGEREEQKNGEKKEKIHSEDKK
jgi:hypothetical protein